MNVEIQYLLRYQNTSEIKRESKILKMSNRYQEL